MLPHIDVRFCSDRPGCCDWCKESGVKGRVLALETCCALCTLLPAAVMMRWVCSDTREFQEEVEERAQREFSESLSASSNGASYPPNAALSNTTVYSSDGRFSAGNGRQPVVAAPPDLQVCKLTAQSPVDCSWLHSRCTACFSTIGPWMLVLRGGECAVACRCLRCRGFIVHTS